MELEIKRQCVHSLGVFLILILQVFGKEMTSLLLFISIILLFILAEYRKSRLKIAKPKPIEEIENLVEDEIKTYERPNELPFKGAITFLIGSFLSIFLFKPFASIASIAVLALADSVSTLIGYYFGKHKTFINRKKTWEGSIAFFITSLTILFFFVPLSIALIVTFISTFVEMLPRIDDNLTVPITVGFLIHYS
jgi:dolichol kinase